MIAILRIVCRQVYITRYVKDTNYLSTARIWKIWVIKCIIAVKNIRVEQFNLQIYNIFNISISEDSLI